MKRVGHVEGTRGNWAADTGHLAAVIAKIRAACPVCCERFRSKRQARYRGPTAARGGSRHGGKRVAMSTMHDPATPHQARGDLAHQLRSPLISCVGTLEPNRRTLAAVEGWRFKWGNG